jgi:hypothetical protein
MNVMRARMAFAMRAPALAGAGIPAWVYAGAALDLDFINQRYFWGGALKTTANFTTYTLNGSTVGANGITMTDTVDVSIALAGVGTVVPGAFGVAFTNTSNPAAAKGWFELDDGTIANRILFFQNTTASAQGLVVAASVSQASMDMGAATTPLSVRHGVAISYAVNDFKRAANGTAQSADVAGTLPTVTTLRLRGVSQTAATGALGRLVLFAAAKSQAEVNAISLDMKNVT